MNKNNMLTRFDEGGLHSQNPLGGIPIGNNNSVEQGETKQDNFIYSNRIVLDSDIVSQYNLPKSLIGKSVADATKMIDSKFKGRNDKISQSTKNLMLSKIAEAQESMKPQETEMVPQENMIEESPETIVEPYQMALGGCTSRKMYNGGFSKYDTLDPNSGIGYKFNSDNTNATNVMSSELKNASNKTGLGLSSALSGASTALELGNIAFGKPSQNTDGLAASEKVDTTGMIGGSALKGAQAGMALGPIGAGVGAVIGGVAGLIGSKKAKKAAFENTQNFAINTNRQFSEQYALGGEIDPPTKAISNKRKYAEGPIDNFLNSLDFSSKEDMSNLKDYDYVNNWYKNRTHILDKNNKPVPMPTVRIKQFPEVTKENLSRNVMGVFNADNNTIKLDTDYSKAEGTYGHELNHKYQHSMNKGKYVNEPIYDSMSKNTKKKYFSGDDDEKYKYTPEEIHSRIMQFRQKNNLNPKKFLKKEDLRNMDGRSDFDLDLLNDDELINMMNRSAYNGSDYKKINIAAYGGMLNPTDPVKVLAAKTGISSSPVNENPLFNTKRIVKYQPGVMNDKLGRGFYLYSKDNTEPGFDPIRDREFIKQSEMLAVQRTPEWKEYMLQQSLNKPQTTFAGGGPIIKPLENFLKPAGLVQHPKIYTGPNNPSSYELGLDSNYTKAASINDFKVPQINVNPQGYSKVPGIIKAADKLGKDTNENIGNLARYAPVVTNALQLKNLQKPQAERLDRLSNRYKPEYVDEAMMRNIVDQEANNQINALTQSGASQGAVRNAILGAGLNKTKALSDAYMNAAAQNRATNDRAQTFNLGVDQVNLNQSNTERENYARDKGNYDTQKSKLIGQLGNDIGNIGKEEIYKKIAKTTTGYSWLGEYQKMNPNATPEETKAAAEKAGILIEDNKTKKALGGYLMKNRK